MKTALGHFPTKSIRHKAKVMKSGLNKEKILQDVTNNTIKNLDNHFQEHYNTSFTKQVNKQNDLKCKHEKTTTVRKAVKDIENQWKETCVER